jgi:hypothetical protein
MNIIKSAFTSIVVVVVMIVFVFSIITVLPIYGQETTTSSITDLIKTTAEKIKNMASEFANNFTWIRSPEEEKIFLIS